MMSDKGLYKHIEESDLPKSDTKELEDLLEPAKKFTGKEKVWRKLPNGDWVRVK